MQHRSARLAGWTRLASLATLLLAGAALAQDAPDIATVRDAWQQAYTAGDAAALGALYTQDAVLYDANGVVVEGREAIVQYFEEGFAGEGIPVTLENLDEQVLGDVGYDIGRWSLTASPEPAAEGGETVGPTSGHYIVILNLVDDQWLIHRNLINADPPAPGVPAEGQDGG